MTQYFALFRQFLPFRLMITCEQLCCHRFTISSMKNIRLVKIMCISIFLDQHVKRS
uniref:Uncharacterized protein n=1 Tax=Parascaris equorum TaxID=6256 RepID=A0A914R6V1_PAREQ